MKILRIKKCDKRFLKGETVFQNGNIELQKNHYDDGSSDYDYFIALKGLSCGRRRAAEDSLKTLEGMVRDLKAAMEKEKSGL